MDKGIGMISANPMEKAFEDDAKFFVLSPPKDSEGRSTRYLVLQRALASLGLYYRYHLRAVSCEVFAMTLLRLKPEFEPIQMEVLPPAKGHEVTDEKREKYKKKFADFHADLTKRINGCNSEDHSLILSLRYYIDHVNPKYGDIHSKTIEELNRIPAWYRQMRDDYEKLYQAVCNNNMNSCKDLLDKGLNVNNKLLGANALAIATHKGHNDLKKFLISRGATLPTDEDDDNFGLDIKNMKLDLILEEPL